jgi:hypothetical protein
MKKLLLLFIFLISLNSVAQQQKKDFKTLSYSELFQMIEAEKDTIFELSDALIVFNPKKDQRFTGVREESSNISFENKDSLYIDKKIVLNQVVFDKNSSFRNSDNKQISGYIHHVVFKKSVALNTTYGVYFLHCEFQKNLYVFKRNSFAEFYKKVQPFRSSTFLWNQFEFSKLKNGIRYSDFDPDIIENVSYALAINHSEISNLSKNRLSLISFRNHRDFQFNNNTLKGEGRVAILIGAERRVSIEKNDFGNMNLYLSTFDENIASLRISQNTLNLPLLIDIPNININANIGWNQFRNKLITRESYERIFRNMSQYGLDSIPEVNSNDLWSLENKQYYLNKLSYENKEAFNDEIKLRGKLYRLFKEQYKTEDANAVYMELKNLETARLKYLFESKPSFDKYFKWKVNQFLKVFSDYGTEPSKAVTFSFYVVLFFAFIYLFFPNTWDSHGKRRIMDRYRFFLKYVNKNSGIHEVYLEEKKPELLASEEFKTYLLEKGKTAPKFFTTTALPLYRWSVASTKTFSWLLSKVDILKGTWSATTSKQKPLKSVLIFIVFFIAILYDIFIKMLNALMLSINTFTTLGFGEIPIKGLPRYLAIIQGFIGWFMLTIFSVSLISQLLN